MIDLTDLQKGTIFAALRNGLGLTNAARGLHIPIDELSLFIRNNPDFHAECKRNSAQGYQYVLSNINTAAVKKHWNNWNYTKGQLQSDFVTGITLWESFCKKEDWSPDKFLLAFRLHKKLDETATAMGLTEPELNVHIFENENIQLYLMENGIAL